MPRTVLVFGGGDDLAPVLAARLPVPDLVVAADSGIDRAAALGYGVDIGIGDLDSVTAVGLSAAERNGARLVRHPTSKAETDLELAMLEAMAAGPERIVVVCIDGGRPDHFLANLALLADVRFAGVMVDGVLNGAEITVIHDKRAVTGRVGELLSLVPMGGDAVGVRTGGLVYALEGECLRAGSPRGVSNVFAAPVAAVSLEAGVLLAIRPIELSASDPDDPALTIGGRA